MERVARQLTAVEETELDMLLLAGLELLPIQDQSQPDFIIVAMHLLLEAVRDDSAHRKDLSIDDFCARLGIVYGEQICLHRGWEWIHLCIHDRYEGVAVSNAKRNRVLFPIPSVYQWTKLSERNRCMEIFTEIKNMDDTVGFHILH